MSSDKKEKKYTALGKRIERLRKAQGLSQTQLAEKLNVSKSGVSNWEQGFNRPKADNLVDLCELLNVSPSELLEVRLEPNEYTSKEKEVITAYRDKPELRHAVHLLLGIDDE